KARNARAVTLAVVFVQQARGELVPGARRHLDRALGRNASLRAEREKRSQQYGYPAFHFCSLVIDKQASSPAETARGPRSLHSLALLPAEVPLLRLQLPCPRGRGHGSVA